MPQSDNYRKSLDQLKSKESQLRQQLSSCEILANRADSEAAKKHEMALRATSASTAKMYLSAAERESKKAADARKKLAGISKKISENSKSQTSKIEQIKRAEKSERDSLKRELEREKQKRRSDERMNDRRKKLKRSAEVRHEQKLAKIRTTEDSNNLRVLYLTTNTHNNLRTDIEIRQVLDALKKSKYRDQIKIEQKPAATFQDLLDGINEFRPQIIHFSGHAGVDSIGLEDGTIDGRNKTNKNLDYLTLAEVIAASDQRPQLIVLNACNTHEGAKHITTVTSASISMSDSIPDTAAIVFAQQFYSAISNGQSIESSYKQAKISVKHILLNAKAADLPKLLVNKDVDPKKLILVGSGSS